MSVCVCGLAKVAKVLSMSSHDFNIYMPYLLHRRYKALRKTDHTAG